MVISDSTAVMFANHGYQVLGVDVSERAINLLLERASAYRRTRSQEYLSNSLVEGTFTVSTTPEEADINQ